MSNPFFEHPLLNSPLRIRRNTGSWTSKDSLLIDGGNGEGDQMSDPLHLVIEIKGYRRENAKEKIDDGYLLGARSE